MSRIRTVKPDFWTSEQVLECSPITRLMFLGMWNFADDTGRLPYSPKSIKAQVFPSDDISIETISGMLKELSTNGLIVIYAIDGKEYLRVTGWHHQRIDKPQPSKYPAPFLDDSGNAIGTFPLDRKGREGIVKESDDRRSAGASAFTEGSKALASSLWKALGFNSLLEVPPEFAGADWRAIEWERAGWTTDLINSQASKIGPGKPLSYYEKVFATEFARRQAPLPIAVIQPQEQIDVRGKPKSSIIQAADDLCRKLASFDGPTREADEVRSITGEATPRLLSNG